MSEPTPDNEAGGPSPSPQTPDPNLPSWARKRSRAANPLSVERLAAFIGPRWPKYQQKFRAFEEDPSFTPTWNWGAAVFQSAWFLYRKLYLAAFGFMLIPSMVFRFLTESDTPMTLTELQKPENRPLLLVQIGVGLSTIIAAGGVGNWLLYRRAKAAAQLADMQELSPTESLPWLERVGGVNNWGVALAVAVFLMSSYAALMA